MTGYLMSCMYSSFIFLKRVMESGAVGMSF